ncbi:hypothetical protein DSM03_103186 [Leeuwenhoekiella aestuarii]|uniref:Uncharacterized protein n=2 Tax=Leeuwenhoekiella aestuarii TaxID=2249426 RepID=A0A4V1KPN3_9FLAO|nr:hypothetical protein DSM03_103186 [Leeuwenhoekiella aestuarii]RXG16695.1 hypothetical protein DSM04_102276 [Leeuwenhoekiella aestuarii]
MPFFNEFGMTEKNIVSHYEFWKKEGSASIENYLWYLFNTLLDENSKQSTKLIDFYKRNARIYSQMISFRRKFENKKANEIQKAYNFNQINLDLESMKDSNLEIEFLIVGVNDCKQSERISNKPITKEQALLNNTIPYDMCSRNTGCVCLVAVRPKRDSDGKLIWKE